MQERKSSQKSKQEIDKLFSELSILAPAFEKAGEETLRFFRDSSLKVTDKGNSGNLVSEADIASENILIERVRKSFPQAIIYAEESGKINMKDQTEMVITVDGIDGTTAFSTGNEEWAISLGIVENKKAVAGFIYVPVKKRLVAAKTGVGVFINGEQVLPITRKILLKDATIQISHELIGRRGIAREDGMLELVFGHETEEGGKRLIKRNIRYPRVLSSSAFGVSEMVVGQIQVAIHPRQAYHDVMPLVAIVGELGGEITTFEGNDIDTTPGSVNDVLATVGIDRNEISKFLPK